MNKSTLSPHWLQQHTSAELRQALIDWQPNATKVFGQTWSSPQELEWLYRTQTGLIVWRDHPLSEQHDDMKRDPVRTGQRHADEWRVKLEVAKAKVFGVDFSRTYVLGINEPHVWDALPQTVDYTVAFLDRLTSYGLRGGALNLSVGWPGNNGPDTPPDWSPYKPIEAAIKRGGHALLLHEYWDVAGPEKMRGWWAERFRHCPWDVPIIIGECGIDRWVDPTNMNQPHTARGWQPWISADEYMRQLAQYDEWCQADGRIIGAQVFTFDYNDKQWESFDVALNGMRERIISHVRASGPATPKPDPKPEPEPEPTPTLAIVDLVGTLPVHPTERYAKRSQPVTNVVIHHSVTRSDAPATNIARFHVNSRGWPGIGYHYIIDGKGNIQRTNTEDTVSYHAGKANPYSIGVCLLGTFTDGRLPLKAQMQAAAFLCADILTRYGLTVDAIIGHKEAPGASTMCPGDQWTTGANWKRALQDMVRQLTKQPPGAHTELYMLLYQFDGGTWAQSDYLGAVNYVGKFRPTIGFSVDDAMKAKQVLIVGGPLGISEQDENRIRAAGAQVGRANGKDEADTAAILNRLAATGTPLP